ncbi:hypothetical protein ACSQ5K_16455 [Pseudomonas sp. PhalM4]
MGFYIIPFGEVSYTVADERFEVDSSDLVPGNWKKTGEAQLKEDDEEYTVEYVANTPHGSFTYTVTLSIGKMAQRLRRSGRISHKALTSMKGRSSSTLCKGRMKRSRLLHRDPPDDREILT